MKYTTNKIDTKTYAAEQVKIRPFSEAWVPVRFTPQDDHTDPLVTPVRHANVDLLVRGAHSAWTLSPGYRCYTDTTPSHKLSNSFRAGRRLLPRKPPSFSYNTAIRPLESQIRSSRTEKPASPRKCGRRRCILGVDMAMTTAFHPQLDGQSERTNQTVETPLRCFLGADTERYATWSEYLPIYP